MIQLSDETIEWYQQFYKDEYGGEISREEAYRQWSNVIAFFELLIELDKKYGKAIQESKLDSAL